VLDALGRLALDNGQLEDAGRNLNRAFAIRERMLGPEHPSLIVSLRSLAFLDLRAGKYPEARTTLERALAIARSKLGSNHLTTLAIMVNLADVSEHENKWADALEMLRRVAAQVASRAGTTGPIWGLNDLDSRLIRDLERLGRTSGRKPQERSLCRGTAPARNPGRCRAHIDVGAVCGRQ
jgi:tetratricopeptide (TPR) repeat protein